MGVVLIDYSFKIQYIDFQKNTTWIASLQGMLSVIQMEFIYLRNGTLHIKPKVVYTFLSELSSFLHASSRNPSCTIDSR